MIFSVVALTAANVTAAELQRSKSQLTAPPELTEVLRTRQSATLSASLVEPEAFESIKTENFEGAWPNDWVVFDGDGATNGEQYWVDDPTRSFGGGWSGWCAGGGLDGVPGGGEYANNMDSWMVYGPFSLADASAATASIQLWLDSEDGFDFLGLFASSNGSNFSGFQYSGSTLNTWAPVALDFSSVGMLGETEVWFALVFTSDEAVTAFGAYVDDIEISKDTAALDFDLELSLIDAPVGPHGPGTVIGVYTEAQNQGPGTSSNWTLDYYLSLDFTINDADTYLGSLVDLPPLVNGEVWAYPVGVTLPLVPDGYYYMGAIITTADSNSANNTAVGLEPIVLSSEPAILVRPTHLTVQGAAPAPAAARQETANFSHLDPASAVLVDKQQSTRALMEIAQKQGQARVIVGLDLVVTPEGRLNTAQRSSQRLAIGAAQAQLAADLRGVSYTEKARYRFIPYMAMSVSPQALQAMVNNPLVVSIEEDSMSFPVMESSNDVIASPLAWMGGYDGNGQAVAILDTGVDTTHPWFTTGGSRIVSEACYSTNGSTEVSLCPGQVASSTEPGSSINCVGVEGCDHGTHVAGIVAGNDFSGPDFGVARGASLIAMQVFTKITDDGACGGVAPCIVAYDSDLLSALQRVEELAVGLDIASVNMSLGGGQYFSQIRCDEDNGSIKAQIDSLLSLGIATVIASGNDGWTDSMGSPGCVSSAISVGATTDGDDIAGFSNIADFIDLLAPGTSITSSVPGGGTGVKQGTSMATPHVAGAWAVLKQLVPEASVTDIRTALFNTGAVVDDLRPGGFVAGMRRINVDLALAALGYIPTEFGIFNTGYGPLDVTAITPSMEAPWLTLSIAPPFSVAPSRLQPVDVIVDFDTAPAGTTNLALSIEGNLFDCEPDCSDRTVYLEVINVSDNIQPVADPQNLATPEDVELPITLTGSDGNGNPLTFTITQYPENGGLAQDEEGDGSGLTYIPFENFNGADSFMFVANDGLQNSEPATVSIDVTSRNDPPWFSTEGDKVWLPGEIGAKSHPGWVTSLVVGPADEAGQALLDYHVNISSDPSGVLSALDVLNDGTLEYTLTGVAGEAVFTVAAQDDGGTDNGGQDTSNPMTFSINVMQAPQGKLETASYVWLLHTPAMFTPQEICCFDYDGDATPDDAWGLLADLVESTTGVDANAELATQIAGAGIVKLMFWSGLPALGEAGSFELEFGNGDWQGVADFPTRVAGQGEFSFNSDGLPDQPVNTVAALVDESGNITGTANSVVSMPLVIGRDSRIIDVPLTAVQIAGTYSDARVDCDGVCSVDEAWNDPPIKGGLKLGGLMHLDDYFAALEEDWQSCLCTGQGNPLFEYGEDIPGGNYSASCTETATQNASSCPACNGLSNICQFMAFLPSIVDVDSNHNTINDSFSVGLRMGFSGATILGCEGDTCPSGEPLPDLIFSDGFEPVDP